MREAASTLRGETVMVRSAVFELGIDEQAVRAGAGKRLVGPQTG